MGYESSAERWSPVQSVEKILLSVVSMLAGKALCGYVDWPAASQHGICSCSSSHLT
jgi:ubiquitin-protein ligase